jgi:hypothetical protein
VRELLVSQHHLINAIGVEEERGRQSKPTLGLSLLRNSGLAAKDIQTNDEAPAFAKATAWQANDEGRRNDEAPAFAKPTGWQANDE